MLSMKFSLVVHSAPYSSQSAATALHFAQQLLIQGHEIYRLFFFGDGAHNASKLAVVPQDETHIQQQWDSLIAENNIDSVVCVSSALKRGIINLEESNRHDLESISLSDNSEIAGLGQLIDASINSDRLVNFG